MRRTALFTLLPVFLLTLPPVRAWADFTSASRGTTTAGFLKLGAGARSAGMGEAYSAVADEATALYWNPGALTSVPSKSAVFMHAAYISSSFFDYGAYAQNLGRYGAFGVGFQYFSAGPIGQTDDTGTDIGSFTPNDLAVSAGYAYELQGLDALDDLNGYSIGLAGKFIESKILATAKTGAVDVGLISPAYFNRLRAAATVVNVGGQMTFEQASEDLPLAFRLGASYKLQDHWTLAADLGLPKDNNPYGAVGSEYVWNAGPGVSIAGRAGFNSRTVSDINGFNGVSFGMGLGLGGFGLDYGLLPFGSIGMAHRVSLSLAF